MRAGIMLPSRRADRSQPQGKVEATPHTDLASPSFSAAQYLVATHANTSFSELQVALKELRRTSSDKTEQLKALVTTHFDQYLNCHEAVRALATDVATHQRDTEALTGDMQILRRATDASLAVMLARVREQRRIRNTLAVLARLRPVLELMAKMKTSLQTQDYDALAADYARIKHQSNKAVSLALPLKRVLTAAHAMAATANQELLQRFEDFSVPIADQKRSLAVLSSLGVAEKPVLTCLTKQLVYVEHKLADLSAQNPEPSSEASEEVMRECVAIMSRFRAGLWSLTCELFKTPTSGSAAASSAATSSEAERVQQQVGAILSSCVGLLERHASPPTASRLRLLNDVFRHLRGLKKCPNAATLNATVARLNNEFCEKFRAKVTLEFLERMCISARAALIVEYFESTVTSLPSLPSELSIGQHSGPPVPSALKMPRTSAECAVIEARQAFDTIRDASTISSESKVHLHRPLVFTSCASAVFNRWQSIWKETGSVLLDMLDDGVDVSSARPSNSSCPTTTAHSHLGALLSQILEKHLHEMLSSFLGKLLATFIVEIAPPMPPEASNMSAACDGQSGARVCILLAIVANCVELREKCLSTVDKWLTQLEGVRTPGSQTLRELVQSTEAQCMDIYSSTHSEPLQRILRAGAIEGPLQTPSSSSSRHNSRTNRAGSLGYALPDSLHPSSSSMPSASTTPSDPRQYVFNVLLLLITLRGEVETSVGNCAECWRYVRSAAEPLTSALATFLQDSVHNLSASNQSTAIDAASLREWTRTHLVVETRFFLLALGDLMAESTKVQLVGAEKQLLLASAGGGGEPAAAAALLGQLKLQTKLYLLALQQ